LERVVIEQRKASRAGYDSAEDDHLENTGSGILRASIFGVSDGLVSNLALVMGVAGGSGEPATIVIAGSVGLLAGAFSMAAGEYVSMQTQRESMQNQLDVEREHILQYPEEEKAHLVILLMQRGLSEENATDMAARIHEDPDGAVDFHAMLELGIIPRQMGSPVAACFSSFASFVMGAAVPLAPWLFMTDALVPSMVASAVALAAVGGTVTRYTSLGVLKGALRQLCFGAAAAGMTFILGRLVASTF
jgi:VIT1/CCC1 family predicted Fe2+/Mn2+ transporter